MKRSTDVVVGKAVERVLARWASCDTRRQTAIYVAKLRLPTKHLRNEAQAIDELVDREAESAELITYLQKQHL